MSVDFKQFLACAPYVIADRKPILIRGKHGVGKSEVVYQLAESLGLPVVERRASQMTEGDLLGMPSPKLKEVNGREASQFAPFEWFLKACTEAVVLFLDEVDRATLEVRQGIFELTDSRKIAGWTLHPDTIVISAINGGEHGAQYQVNEMDPAELDRYVVFDIEPTVEDWLNWGGRDDNKQIHAVFWDFINNNRNHLEHSGEYSPNKVYPTRRSWKRLNDCFVKGRLFTKKAAKTNIVVMMNLAKAYVGLEAGIALIDYMKTYEHQLTWEDIVNDGAYKKTEKWGINKHSAMIDSIAQSDIFYRKEKLTDQQWDNLVAYSKIIPNEIFSVLFMKMVEGSAKGNYTDEYLKRFHSATRQRVLDTIVADGQAEAESE